MLLLPSLGRILLSKEFLVLWWRNSARIIITRRHVILKVSVDLEIDWKVDRFLFLACIYNSTMTTRTILGKYFLRIVSPQLINFQIFLNRSRWIKLPYPSDLMFLYIVDGFVVIGVWIIFEGLACLRIFINEHLKVLYFKGHDRSICR